MIRRETSPALAGSVLLHGAVTVALLISWNFTRDLKVGAIVPVTIVANAPETNLAPAVQAPDVQTAHAEEPDPTAPAEVTPLAPQPKPKPEPAPKVAPPPPTPKPAPVPMKPAPVAAKPAPPAKPEKSLDLDALAASISRSAKPSSADKGPTRPETALQARETMGTAQQAAAFSGLSQELQRRWNPNCDVEGGREVMVRVTFTIGAGGQVVGNVGSEIKGAPTPVSQAAAQRAVRAVYAASPFRSLPREFYGDRVAVNFNAREACS